MQKRERKAAAFALALAAALPLAAAECVWSGASGNWGDAAGWQGGVKPSAQGDTVRITGGGVAVTVRDTDVANFQLVTKVTIEQADAQLVVDTGAAVSSPAVFAGDGTLVKKGTSAMTLTTAGEYPATLLGYLGGGVVILNGTLQLPHRDGHIELSRVEVDGNGVLSLGSSPQTHVSKGLWGDGTITNPNTGNLQLYLFDTDADNPPVFSGSFGGNVQLTSYYADDKPSVQYLTGSTDIDLTLRINGILGAKTLGSKGGAGSLGTGSIPFRNRYSGVHFLNETEETTDKNFQFWSSGALVRLKASTYGGMTFTGTWNLPAYTSFGPNYKYNTIVFEGENTERANVVSVSDMYDSDARSTVYWRKEGTGIWRIANIRPDIHGTFEVRRGTLEFDSLYEKGTHCALGRASRTGPDVSDWPDADRVTANVPLVAYAYRLGNAAAEPLAVDDDYLPTMKYIGAEDVVCSTRPFVVDGVGRILSSGGVLSLAGASAFTNGTHTLVLDGAGTSDRFNSVTNGPLGTLDVVKRGTGTWKLQDDIRIGTVRAEQGTLEIGASYGFYRWTITANKQGVAGGEEWLAMFNGFAVMDAEGNVVNGTLGKSGVATAKIGHPERLASGEITYSDGKFAGTGEVNRPIDRGFDWNPETQMFRADASSIEVTVKKDDPSTHPVVYFRTDPGVEVAKYDILAYGSNHDRAVAQWELAGSVDGRSWNVLHTVDDSNMSEMPMANNTWYSDKQNGKTPSKGYDVAIGDTNATLNVAAVGASAGATLAFVGNAAGTVVNKVVLDANGGGTIRGAVFAESGTLDLTNWSASKLSETISLDLTGCTDYKYIENWTVMSNGKALSNRIKVTGEGVMVLSEGLIIIFR